MSPTIQQHNELQSTGQSLPEIVDRLCDAIAAGLNGKSSVTESDELRQKREAREYEHSEER